MPRHKKKSPAPVLAWTSERPTVLLIWVAPSGEICRKTAAWKRPSTTAALEDWLEEYRERVATGYQPVGFEEPPMPHCARVMIRNRLVAEWNRGLTAEELRRIDSRRSA